MESQTAAPQQPSATPRIILAVLILIAGAAVFVKAAFFKGDVFLYGLSAILVISGVRRLSSKSS